MTEKSRSNTLSELIPAGKNNEAQQEEAAPENRGFLFTGGSKVTGVITASVRNVKDLQQHTDRYNEAQSKKQLALLGHDEAKAKKIALSLSQKDCHISVITQKFTDTRTATAYSKLPTFLYSKITPIVHDKATFSELKGQKGIYFTAEELARLGMYKDKRFAKVGIAQLKDALLSQQVLYSYIPKGKKRADLKTYSVLFTDLHTHKKGVYFVVVNPSTDWGVLLQYVNRLPNYYYALPSKAATLTRLIFSQIDCNKSQIKEQGFITITYRAIQRELDLPSEHTTSRHKEYIATPIIDAISTIQKAQTAFEAGSGRTQQLQLKRIEDNTGDITQWLNNSKLKITLCGGWLEEYAQLATEQQNRIEQKKELARKRKYAQQQKATGKK